MTRSMTGLAAAAILAAAPAIAQPLLSPEQLAGKLDEENLVVLDIRSQGEAATHPFEGGRVAGAVKADYRDGWRVTRDGVPGMLPPLRDVAALIGGFGVDNDDHVVIANLGEGANGVDMGAATRVYWTFKLLGHEDVSILEGGWRAWEAAGLPVESGPAEAPEPAEFAVDFQDHLYADAADVGRAIADPNGLLLDGRPAAQFDGAEKSGVVARAGALPGAANYPVQSMVTDNGGRFADPAEIAARLSEIEARAGAPTTIAYCNTGHWASLAWFAASEIAGRPGVAVYDGSMADWAAAPVRPVIASGGASPSN